MKTFHKHVQATATADKLLKHKWIKLYNNVDDTNLKTKSSTNSSTFNFENDSSVSDLFF